MFMRDTTSPSNAKSSHPAVCRIVLMYKAPGSRGKPRTLCPGCNALRVKFDLFQRRKETTKNRRRLDYCRREVVEERCTKRRRAVNKYKLKYRKACSQLEDQQAMCLTEETLNACSHQQVSLIALLCENIPNPFAIHRYQRAFASTSQNKLS